MFAQAPMIWPEILQHSALVGVVLFFGYGLAYITKRLFGEDGIITNQTTIASASLVKTTETLVAQTITLDKLEANATAQQGLCVRHAAALETVGVELDGVEGKLDKTVDATTTMAEQWGGRNHHEYKTGPILDAMLHAIDTAESLAMKCNCECGDEMRSLRGKIAEVKEHMQRGQG